MLKQRIVGVLLAKGGRIVQSIGFSRYLPVGRPEIAVEYLNAWGIDEIALLDMDAGPRRKNPDPETISGYARLCRVPLAVGGGITELAHVEAAIRSGADKVVINNALAEAPAIVEKAAYRFGSQSIIASIDCREVQPGRYEVFRRSGSIATGRIAAEMAKMAEALGAGELLVNSIDRDGSKLGYDLALIEEIMTAVSIPVIALGGVGRHGHLAEGLALGVSAVAAANYFHFTEHSVITAKRWLMSKGVDIRLETYADYENAAFDDTERITKPVDEYLENLRFVYIPEEII